MLSNDDHVRPLVSDAEVAAAKDILDRMAATAGREQPVPDTLIRIMLEEAAMVRTGMIDPPNPSAA